MNLEFKPAFNLDRSKETESECTFCKIIRGELEASIILRTKRVICFVSLEGYPLVVPIEHVENILDPKLNDSTVRELGSIEARIARIAQKVFDVNSITIMSANGPAAGQEIYHYHIHVIPREDGDRKIIARRGTNLERNELDKIANNFREKLI